MKIVCDKCNARYSLSDDKVRTIGRSRFGVRCKTCGNLIRVTVIEAPIEPTPEELRRFTPAPPPPKEKSSVDIFSDADLDGEFGRAFDGQAAAQHGGRVEPAVRTEGPTSAARASSIAGPAGAATAAKKKREDTKLYDYREFQALLKAKGLLGAMAKGKAEKPPEVEWYLALDGNQTGPYSRKDAEAKVARDADLAENGFAWRDGLADWLPVVDLPELKEAARKAIGARGVQRPKVSEDAGLPKPRDEQSVLFSLDALKESTLATKAPAVAGPAKPQSGESSTAVADKRAAADAVAPVSIAAAKSIVTPIVVGKSSSFAPKLPPVAAKPAGPRQLNRLFVGIGIAIVAGGGAAVAYFAVQPKSSAPPVASIESTERDARRAPGEAEAPRGGAWVDSRDVARLPLPEAAGTAPRAAARAGSKPEAAEPSTSPGVPDVRPVGPARPAVAVAAPYDDDKRDRRRRKGKRRRGRETARLTTSSEAATAGRTERAAPSSSMGQTPARVLTPSPSAARGDAVLDDILGGTSSPPARLETPRPARRAEARRAEARAAAPAPRREESAPVARPDPPRETPRTESESSLPRTLDGSDIKAQVERNRHRVNLCYSSTVSDKSEKKGRLVVSFTIQRNGRPSRVAVDRAGYWGSEMASCVTTAFSRLRFGSFSGDPIEVRFPFVLGDF